MAWQLIMGAAPLAIVALATEDAAGVSWSPAFALNLFVLSIFGTAAAFVLWFALLQKSNLNRLNVFSFLTPIFGLFMGAAFFSERLGTLELAGVALSLLGILVVSRWSNEAARST